MVDIVLLYENVNESFKSILLNYINEKNDSHMIFGHLCIIHYREFSKDNNPTIITVAAAIELIVLSFDIIDDLQDDDTNYLWSKEPDLAMNATLAMIFFAVKSINESQFKHKQLAIGILNDFALKSINGQYLDLLNKCRSEDSYLKMISSKSGSLTTLSSLLGQTLALGESEPRIIEYSNYIGVIQQIKNDIEDLKSWDKKNDLLNKKFSLPIIYLFETGKESSKILANYYNGIISCIDKEYFNEELIESGAIHYAIAMKNTYKYRALKVLETIPFSNESKQYLKLLIE